MNVRTVGVLGGMGPAATWDFCARLLSRIPAATDAEHPRVVVDCDPSVPDRNAAVLGTGPSPEEALIRMARSLERAGADLLCMPCNAAHAYAGAVRDATPLPFVDMIEATVRAVSEGGSGAPRVAVLATRGTLHARLYERAFAAHGVDVLPVSPARAEAVMEVVRAVKAGDVSARVRARAAGVADAFVREGAGTVIAACTEIPLVLDADAVAVPLVASTDALAAEVARVATRTGSA